MVNDFVTVSVLFFLPVNVFMDVRDRNKSIDGGATLRCKTRVGNASVLDVDGRVVPGDAVVLLDVLKIAFVI